MKKYAIIPIILLASSCGPSETTSFEQKVVREIERARALCEARSDRALDPMKEWNACLKEYGLDP